MSCHESYLRSLKWLLKYIRCSLQFSRNVSFETFKSFLLIRYSSSMNLKSLHVFIQGSIIHTVHQLKS
jgi:hypothetical protein